MIRKLNDASGNNICEMILYNLSKNFIKIYMVSLRSRSVCCEDLFILSQSNDVYTYMMKLNAE